MGSLQKPSELVTVEFPGTPPVNIAEGQTKQIELTLRKPKDRFVCFVDDLGLPVPGVRVVSEVFWTAGNRCGWILAIG